MRPVSFYLPTFLPSYLPPHNDTRYLLVPGDARWCPFPLFPPFPYSPLSQRYGFASKGSSVVAFADNSLRRMTYVPITDGPTMYDDEESTLSIVYNIFSVLVPASEMCTL